MNGVHSRGLTRLAVLLRLHRAANRDDTRTTAKQIGISAATLNRIERGHSMDADTLIKVLNWLLRPEAGKDAPTHG